MMGKPVVAGTRITVENILERLGTGESVETILAGASALDPPGSPCRDQLRCPGIARGCCLSGGYPSRVKLLGDENIDHTVIVRLRDAGHTVLAVAEMEPGIDDATVLKIASENAALLLTEDKDFGELVFRQRLLHTGVILVRLSGLAPEIKADFIVSALAEHGTELTAAFTVISPGILRIRTRD